MRACLALVITVTLSVCAARASAQTPPVTTSAAELAGGGDSVPQAVSITIVGEPADTAAVDARVVSWFHEQGTLTHSAQQSAVDPEAFFSLSGEASLRIWIVLKLPNVARVFFAVQRVDRDEAHFLVRDVALDSGLDELGLEQLAQVVNLSATALWTGTLESSRQEVEQGLGIVAVAQPGNTRARPELPPLERTEEAMDHRPPRWRGSWLLGAEYSAKLAGPEGIFHGPAAGLGARWQRRALELGGRARVQLFIPEQVTRESVTLDLRGAAFGLGASVAYAMSERLAATGELGSGIDFVRYRAISLADTSFEPTAGASELRPLSYARVGMRADVGVLELEVALLLAVQFLRTHYDVVDAGRRSERVRPWLAQPGLAIGASW